MAFDPVLNLSDLDGSNGFVIKGIDERDWSGGSVSSAGDVNGDGFDDILIGASGADPNGSWSGETYVVFGSSAGFAPSFDLSSLDASNGFVLNGINALDDSGNSVSSAGDVNGDGFDDVIIGALSADPNGHNSGESYVVFGRSDGFTSSLELSSLDGRNGFVLNGIDFEDYSGRSVSSAGDVNGDGIDDIIIGASGADPNGSYSGESYVVFGKSGGFASSLDLSSLDGSNGFVLNGIDNFNFSGWSVSSAGDVNGDRFDDILIGARGADSFSGESYVVFGTSGGFASSVELSKLNGNNGFVLNGIDETDFSGSSVSSAGDVNGDGFDDILIGAYSADPNGDFSGESYVVFGSSGGFTSSLDLSSLDGSNGFVINGIDEFDQSGWSVSSAGDVNGDGFDDILIRADGIPISNRGAGESYVVFGSSAGFESSFELSALDGSNGFVINGINELDRSGWSVSSAGDVNGDGFDDILIGAPRADSNGGQSGETYVIFGRPTSSNSNNSPVAVDDTFTTEEDVAATFDVLSNDSDPDDDNLSINSVTQPVNGGTVTPSEEGQTLVYTPSTGFTGTDTFTYGVSDGSETDTATVTVIVEPAPNTPPNAVDDQSSTSFNTPININILDNDTDPDNSPNPISIIAESITTAANGTVVFNDNGTSDPSDDFITYTPNPGFVGVDSFEYAITDGLDNSQSATVTITVNPLPTTVVNGTVFADSNGDNVFSPGESALPAITVNLLDNDGNIVDIVETDANGDYTLTDIFNGEYLVQVDPNDSDLPRGSILGTPNSLPIFVADVPVTGINFGFDIPPSNQAPTATNETLNTSFNSAISFNLSDNVSDSDGTVNLSTIDLDPTTPEINQQITLPNGTFTVNPEGLGNFEPVAGFSGTAEIAYTVDDNDGATSNVANISVTVNLDTSEPPEDQPTNGDDLLVGTEGNDTIAGLLGNDQILGLGGDDVLRGDQNKRSPGSPQQGNDTIFGGAGDDRIGGKGGDDELYGDEGDDQIWGDEGDDILRGGLGDDILTGDDFSGGNGSDTFILAPGEGTDTIVDFEVGIDRISLIEGLTFTDLTLTSGTNEVSVNFGEETLATVLGVNTLTEADFEFV